MKKILLTLLVFVVSVPFYGQEKKSIEQLLQIWNNQNLDPAERAAALYDYTTEVYMYNQNPDSCIHYHQKIYNFSEKHGIATYKSKSALEMGRAYTISGKLDKSTHFINESVVLFKALGDSKGLAQAYMNLGVIKRQLGSGKEALIQYEKTENLLKKLQDEPTMASVKMNKANVYFLQGNLKKAAALMEEVIPIYKKLNNENGLITTYLNIGYTKQSLGNYKEAIEYYHLGRDLSQKEEMSRGYLQSIIRLGMLYKYIGDKESLQDDLLEGIQLADSLNFDRELVLLLHFKGENELKKEELKTAELTFKRILEIGESTNKAGTLMRGHLGLGDTYLAQGAFDKAEEYYQKIVDVKETEFSERSRFLPAASIGMTKVKIKQGHWEEARKYGEAGLALAEMVERPVLEILTKQLSEIYSHFGAHDKAFAMLERHLALKDSIQDDEIKFSLLKNQIEFEYAQKALADSLQNASKLLVQKTEAKRRRATSNYLLLGLVLTLVFGILLWNRYRISLKQKKIIENEKVKLDLAYSDLNAANDSLKELDASKSRFFTNISHEFRTPLTVIKGMTERLKSDSKAKRLIQRNADQLLQLINQILDLRKLEAGQLSPQYIQGDIVKYLRYLVESFHSLANDNGITLEFKTTSPSLLLDFDPDKILTITSNIISNALKFTPENGSVCLSVKDTDESYEFTITDTGPGIEKDKLPFLFDRFYQVDGSVSRTGEGTGIGLALVKELAELMDGSVIVESEVDKGTAFTVKLPRTNNAVLQDAPTVELKTAKENYKTTAFPESNSDNQSELPHLLLVEDNPDVMEYLSTFLQESYRLSFAKDGLQGIKMALEMVPDLLISDVMMPKKNGFELCHALKSDERTSHIPIILLTAKADADAQLNGLLQGADDYLIKPFDRRELEIRLKNILANRMRLQARYSAIDQLEPTTDKAVLQEDAFVLKLRQIIQEHMGNENFGVPQLCREAAMSRTQLHNKLKSLTSRSTSQFIRDVRMNKAVDLLRNSQLNISEIALEVGIGNLSYFSRIFSNETGHSPNRYREIMTSEQ